MTTSAYSDDQAAQITQLQQQQSLFTQALAAMMEGRWQGDASVEAYLYALNPMFQGQLAPDVPVTQSEYEGEPPKA
jgi:hypothetical protein